MKNETKKIKKIAEVALKAKGYKDINALMKVVDATLNPETSLEILLGIYEEPVLTKTSNIAKDAKLVKFDSMEQDYRQVTYSFMDKDRKYIQYDPNIWSDKEAQKEYMKDPDGWIDAKGNDVKGISFNLGTFHESESYCSVYDWQNSKSKPY